MPRSIKNPGIFAENANTTIPPTPVVSESYRDAATGLDDIAEGWPFKNIVDSKDFNQILHQLTSLTDLIDRTGILEWKNDVEYDIVPAYVQGSDGEIYKSLQASGPATTPRDPTTQAAYWKKYNPLAELGFGVDVTTTTGLSNADDLDTVLTSGLYAWSGSSIPANAPSLAPGSYGDMLVFPSTSSANSAQLVIDRVNSRIFYRGTSSNVFNPWVEIGSSGPLTNTVVFTAGGTYNPPAGVRSLEFTCIGAGGGGGGADGQGSGTSGCAIGGGGGGTAIITTSTIDSSYTVVIGAGGAGGAAGNNPGAAGGNSTVVDGGPGTNVNIAGNGGAGGDGALGSSGAIHKNGADGGTATGGDTNFEGGASVNSHVFNGIRAGSSHSGASILGGSLRSGSNVDGADAVTPGAGGAAVDVGTNTINAAGGDGADGIVIIKEFF